MWQTEVVIVGKGIAGLTLSYLLKQAGINHVLLARQEESKSLPLAETLPPTALPLLRSLNLLDLVQACAINKTTGYHSCWGRDQVTDHNFYFQYPDQHGFKVDKQQLISGLMQLQHEFIHEHSKDLDIRISDQIVVKDNRRHLSLTGQFIVDATGRNRYLLRRLGVESVQAVPLQVFSTHLPATKLKNLPHGVYVESFPDGWGIVSELSARTNVISLFTNVTSENRAAFRSYEHWPELLKTTRLLKQFLVMDFPAKVIGGDASSSVPDKITGINWLAVGDAAMSFDPVSSHGITSAIYTAWKACEVLKGSEENRSFALKRYEMTLRNLFQTYNRQRIRLYASERRWADTPFWSPYKLTHTHYPPTPYSSSVNRPSENLVQPPGL